MKRKDIIILMNTILIAINMVAKSQIISLVVLISSLYLLYGIFKGE